MLEDHRDVSFPAFRISQPIGDFYIGAMKAADLFRIAFFDIRGLREKDGFSQYLGIQRQLSEKRVSEIKRYVTTVDATFPTAIILAVDERCVELTEIDCGAAGIAGSSLCLLRLRNVPEPAPGDEPVLFRQIARVLDGQHRIAGLAELEDRGFDINVALFVGLDVPSQAGVFSVVNLAQTKVNASLVYDLLAYDQARSPEKTCHEIAVALDGARSSPFFQRIKRLGVATQGRFGETLTQATFVRALLPYLTDDVLGDREIGKRGGRWPNLTADQKTRLIFREEFTHERDFEIAEVIWNYFSAVEARWEIAWNWLESGRILNRTTGFQGLMRFLGPAVRRMKRENQSLSKDGFQALFAISTLDDHDFNTDNFKPGSSGVSALYNRLLVDTKTTL